MTTPKITKERAVWLIAVISLIAFFLFSKIGDRDTDNEILHFNDTTKHETVKGIDVATIHQALLENQKQLKTMIELNDTLRKLVKDFKITNSITKIKTEIHLKDSIVYQAGTIPCDFKPIHEFKKTSDYAIKFTVEKNRLLIDSLSIPNTLQIIEGSRKIGLFKTEQQVMAVNSNPLVRTVNMQSLTIKRKKKIWEHPGIWFGLGAGLATGLFIMAK